MNVQRRGFAPESTAQSFSQLAMRLVRNSCAKRNSRDAAIPDAKYPSEHLPERLQQRISEGSVSLNTFSVLAGDRRIWVCGHSRRFMPSIRQP